MNDTEVLRIRLEQRVLWLVIDRPASANALDQQVSRSLIAQLNRAGSDPQVGAVVLTAAGARVFCAGADLKELSELPPHEASRLRRWTLIELLTGLLDCVKPVLVAVQGKAVGAGTMLCALGDAVLASRDAAFSLPEIRLGMATPVAVAVMSSRMAPSFVTSSVLRAEPMTAEQAQRAGLIDELVAPDALTERAAAEAARLASLSGDAFAATKRWRYAAVREAIVAAANEAQRLQDRHAPG